MKNPGGPERHSVLLAPQVPEDQGDAPQGGQAHQDVDHPAGHTGLPAEEGGHDVVAEQADAAPVEPADDGQDQGDFIDDHREETSSDWIPRIALPGSGRIMHHTKLEIKCPPVVLWKLKNFVELYISNPFSFICVSS